MSVGAAANGGQVDVGDLLCQLSPSMLWPKSVSGSEVLSHPGSLLMSMAGVTSEGHVDICAATWNHVVLQQEAILI